MLKCIGRSHIKDIPAAAERGVEAELEKVFHRDRFAHEPEKQKTYHKLTAAINRAKDHGDLATLRRDGRPIWTRWRVPPRLRRRARLVQQSEKLARGAAVMMLLAPHDDDGAGRARPGQREIDGLAGAFGMHGELRN